MASTIAAELLQPRHRHRAGACGRVVGAERRRPDRAAGEQPGRAAAAGGLDRARERVGRDALREHDPRHRQDLVDRARHGA